MKSIRRTNHAIINFEDGGAEAAKQHLGIELGGAVTAIFEKAEDELVD